MERMMRKKGVISGKTRESLTRSMYTKDNKDAKDNDDGRDARRQKSDKRSKQQQRLNSRAGEWEEEEVYIN